MNQQLITSFFKMKSDIKPKSVPKHRLSLKRSKSANVSPMKSVKVEQTSNVEIIAIDSSDGENSSLEESEPIFKNNFNNEDASAGRNDESSSPNQDQKNNNSPSTSTKKKYFSPNKRHMISVRKFSVQRDLLSDFENVSNEHVHISKSESGLQNYEDKSTYFAQMIQNFLQDPTISVLLSGDARNMIESTTFLPTPGITVVYRLFWRRKGWFRRDKLLDIINKNVDCNSDGININYVLIKLIDHGFLEKGDETNMSTIEDFTEHLVSAEDIQKICAFLKIKKASKKNGIVKLKRYIETTTNVHTLFYGKKQNNLLHVLNIIRSQIGACYRLTEKARSVIHRLYILMYLGIPYDYIRDKSLEYMIVCERNKIETFPITKTQQLDKPNIVFNDETEFEEYVKTVEIYEDFLSSTDVNYKCDVVQEMYKNYRALTATQKLRYAALPSWLRRYTPAYVYVKIMVSGIAALKNSKKPTLYNVAIEILTTLMNQDWYRQHEKIEWCAEKALIYNRYLKLPTEAAKELVSGFVMDVPKKYKDHICSRALNLAKLKNTKIVDCLKQLLYENGYRPNTLESTIKCTIVNSLPIENKNRGKSKYMIYTSDGTREEVCVEECAKRWYASNTTYDKGGHWEGKIIVTLFYLLFWDIIYKQFTNIRGIYMNMYQRDPLDLYTPDFYANRRLDIVNRLNMIRKSDIRKIIQLMKTVWDKRPSSELSGISRDIGWYNCEQVAICLGPNRIWAICDRLAKDFKYSYSGFPDLTIFDSVNMKVKFVEVKSDNDHPSMKQIQWMHYLKNNNMDTEFCYVGTKATASKSRRRNNNN